MIKNSQFTSLLKLMLAWTLLSGISTSWAFNEKNKEKTPAFGVLVRIQNKDILKDKSLVSLSADHQLLLGDFYPTFNVQMFKLKNNNSPLLEKDWKSFCHKAKKIKGVLACEPNLKLRPESSNNSCPSPPEITQNPSIPQFQGILSNLKVQCQLVSNLIPAPHGRTTLSTFWAQEYTGADLLRQRLETDEKMIDKQIASNLVQIWDTHIWNHGTAVSNLILGPYPSASIPQTKSLGYVNLVETEDYFKSYEMNFTTYKNNNRYPNYLNISMEWSMSWSGSNLIAEVFRKLNDKGTVIITIAGNDSIDMRIPAPTKHTFQEEKKMITRI